VIGTLGVLLVFVFAIRAFAQSPGQLLAAPASRKGLVSDRGNASRRFMFCRSIIERKKRNKLHVLGLTRVLEQQRHSNPRLSGSIRGDEFTRGKDEIPKVWPYWI
jgi:hypothetical protein